MWVVEKLPPDLFWELTFREVEAVLERCIDKTRAANLRAGLVAATIANVHRRKGARMLTPSDFIVQPVQHMSIEEATTFMDRWAESQNQSRAKSESMK